MGSLLSRAGELLGQDGASSSLAVLFRSLRDCSLGERPLRGALQVHFWGGDCLTGEVGSMLVIPLAWRLGLRLNQYLVHRVHHDIFLGADSLCSRFGVRVGL